MLYMSGVVDLCSSANSITTTAVAIARYSLCKKFVWHPWKVRKLGKFLTSSTEKMISPTRALLKPFLEIDLAKHLRHLLCRVAEHTIAHCFTHTVSKAVCCRI